MTEDAAPSSHPVAALRALIARRPLCSRARHDSRSRASASAPAPRRSHARPRQRRRRRERPRAAREPRQARRLLRPGRTRQLRLRQLRSRVPGRLRVRRQLPRLPDLRHLRSRPTRRSAPRSSARAGRARSPCTGTCSSCRPRRRGPAPTAARRPRPDRRPAALPRRPDLRHLEPQRARPGRGGADVPWLAHAHPRSRARTTRTTSTSTSPGPAAFASATEMAGCVNSCRLGPEQPRSTAST